MALQMRALGDAVAAADLVAVGHGGGAGVALVTGVADVRLAEHQLVADVGDGPAFAQQLEVPAAVDRVAVQAGADQLVALDHQLLVDAAVGIAHDDLLAIVAAGKVAGREQVDAGDLELGAGLAAAVAADAEFGQVRGADLALLEQRRHQAVGDAAVRGTFADRIDARVGDGLHRVADDDAAAAVQADLFGQRGVRADADGHHHQLRRHFAAVLELHRAHAAVGIADETLGVGADQELQSARFQRLLQQAAGDTVELAFHQPWHQVHHMHVHAAAHQAVGRFQPEQAAADDHRVAVARGRVDHFVGVLDVAVGDHALQFAPRQRRHERRRAGGQQQAVVFGLRAVVGDDQALAPLDVDHRLAQVQRDAVLGIPGQRVEHDLVERLLAAEHRRQQDAVVVRVRLGAEDGDLVQLGRQADQLFHRAHRGHAVADHHQLHLLHSRFPRSNAFRNTRPSRPGSGRRAAPGWPPANARRHRAASRPARPARRARRRRRPARRSAARGRACPGRVR